MVDRILYSGKVSCVNWKTVASDQLVRAILALKTAEETRAFLRDLLTEGEIEEFGRRLQTAAMLSDKASYASIEEKTGFSSRTIARVSRWLQNGTGGYRLILRRLHHRTSLS